MLIAAEMKGKIRLDTYVNLNFDGTLNCEAISVRNRLGETFCSEKGRIIVD